MNLATLLLQAMVLLVPPGHTKFSVEPVDCRADDCDRYRRSTYYDGWVQQESQDAGILRYGTIAEAAVTAVQIELCRDENGKPLDGCIPYPDAKRGWTRRSALSAVFGAAIPESGLREDVQTGRGRAKRPDDAGGEGRGPANEACLMQINPRIAWRFVPDLTPAERAAAQGGAARDALMTTLVGRDRESLVRCFRTGFRMLATAAAHCHWRAAKDATTRRKSGGPVVAVPTVDVWATFAIRIRGVVLSGEPGKDDGSRGHGAARRDGADPVRIRAPSCVQPADYPLEREDRTPADDDRGERVGGIVDLLVQEFDEGPNVFVGADP